MVIELYVNLIRSRAEIMFLMHQHRANTILEDPIMLLLFLKSTSLVLGEKMLKQNKDY